VTEERLRQCPFGSIGDVGNRVVSPRTAPANVIREPVALIPDKGE
jgi:hypothetical protein